jgi:L-ascorbate metabolism protein UlaG (beta-lactamase superfamily)
MKIKPLGYMSFLISFDNFNLITDPQSIEEAGLKLSKTEAEVIVVTDEAYLGKTNVIETMGLSDKIVSVKRPELFEIVNFGEYEIGEVMFRRPTNRNFFLMDEDYIRVMYLGYIGNDFNPDSVKNLGDVDVLIAPIGDGTIFPQFQKMQKAIANIDPSYLIPYGFKVEGMSENLSTLRSVEDFIKDAGYTNVREDKELKISASAGAEDKVMEIVVLK